MTAAAPRDDDEVREAVSAAGRDQAGMAQVHRVALRKVATEAISRTRAELEGGWAERERSYQQGIAPLGAELDAVEVDAQALRAPAGAAALSRGPRARSCQLALQSSKMPPPPWSRPRGKPPSVGTVPRSPLRQRRRRRRRRRGASVRRRRSPCRTNLPKRGRQP